MEIKTKINRRRSLSFNKSASINRLGLVSAFSFAALLFATVCPLYNVSGTESVEAMAGTSQDSTITFTATRTTASASLETVGSSGSFTTSTNDQKASFTITTNNYTGYELKIKSSTNNTLTDSSSSEPSTISPITNVSGITSSEFTNNTWGYIPNYYNSIENSTNKYYPITTSDVTLRKTTSANVNNTPDTYTIGIGIKADYDTPAGTYTNNNLVLTYVANPVTYAITYDKGNTTDTVANLPTTQAGEVSASSVTLSSTTPTRTGYDFTGWCLGAISTNSTTKVDSCVNDTANNITAKTFQSGGSFGIDQTIMNNAALHAMWSIKSYSITLSRDTGASAIVIDGTSHTDSSVSLTYGTHAISGIYSSDYKFSSWAVSGNVAFASGMSSSAETGNIVVTGTGALVLNSKKDIGKCTSESSCMQTATMSMCGTTFTDARDGKTYTTRKIDDRCYMTSDLNLAGGTALTSADSNVASNYTLPASSGSGSVYNRGSTSYYSYVVATAGTNPSKSYASAPNDICPKGWRLPTISNLQDIEYYMSSFSPTGAGVHPYNYDSGSYYWSSTTGIYSNYARYLEYHPAGYPQISFPADVDYMYGIGTGMTVRCVLK